jgi:hypothetical protein
LFEFVNDVLTARVHLNDTLQHLDELARPITFIGKVLREQLDIVQQVSHSVFPGLLSLGLGVNDQSLQGPERLGVLFHTDHGLPPKSKPTSSILVPHSPQGTTLMGG